jgi:hypothetical protein
MIYRWVQSVMGGDAFGEGGTPPNLGGLVGEEAAALQVVESEFSRLFSKALDETMKDLPAPQPASVQAIESWTERPEVRDAVKKVVRIGLTWLVAT